MGIKLSQGSFARIINTEGSHVVDVWAYRLPKLDEFLSMEHTRSCLEKLTPTPGDLLYSNRRQPMIQVIEDTSPGMHDLLLSACDLERYRLLGHKGWHANCADNFQKAIKQFGIVNGEIPSPLNMFENVSITNDGSLRIAPPVVTAGQYVTLRAECNLVLIFSACPMDIAYTNGLDRRVKPIEIETWSMAVSIDELLSVDS